MKNIPFKFILLMILLLGLASASQISVWQGQYYTGTTFNKGTYEFNFTVYDNETGGEICYSNSTNLTTGNFGEWKIEQKIGSYCSNASKDYFLEIKIEDILQSDTNGDTRERLTIFDYLRRDVNEIYIGNLTFEGALRTNSPLKIKQSMQYVNPNDEVIYNSFVQGQNALVTDIPEIFNDSLIYFKIKSLANNYGYKVVYFDNITKQSLFTLSRNINGRASTIFNLMVVPENKTTDTSFNLCKGTYVDCDSNDADLLVYDDIESGGSIFSNENVTAKYFVGDGSFLTGITSFSGYNYTKTDYVTTNFSIYNTSILSLTLPPDKFINGECSWFENSSATTVGVQYNISFNGTGGYFMGHMKQQTSAIASLFTPFVSDLTSGNTNWIIAPTVDLTTINSNDLTFSMNTSSSGAVFEIRMKAEVAGKVKTWTGGWCRYIAF